jgi:hypothetical protein
MNQENIGQGNRAPAGRLDSVLSNKETGARRKSKSSADFVRSGMMVVNFGQVKVRKVHSVT